jgi:polyhydroxyalkanoate synthase
VDPLDFSYGLNAGAVDPVGIWRAVGEVGAEVMTRPDVMARSWLDLGARQSAAGLTMMSRFLGAPVPEQSAANGDRRFADRAWRDNPYLSSLLESYLAYSEWALSLVDQSRLPEQTRRKARFGLRWLIDALAPSNVPWLNPAVVKEAIDTGGLSVMKGMANMLDDSVHNGGYPRQVDKRPFELGRNMAATPGRVVFRNDLMEVLAYQPQTPTVHAQPILCSPPWINKYYVMDLAPKRSFIEFAVQSGFLVFAISYRNPDATMAGVSMDDYLTKGLLAALDVARAASGSEVVNVVGLCLGGTLTAVLLGYLAAGCESGRIGWAALTNTLVDFGEPGELGVFADEDSVARLEKEMQAKGYLEARSMASTFDWLRGNDLVWNYVVSNWYMGKEPPAFDLLAWNSDSTNMPAAMHAQYLRTCYLQNALARPGAFRIAGRDVDLRRVQTPVYVLAAENDHIAPWRSSYRTTQLVGGPARFTLTSAGHIAGIVNPLDSPKSMHWVREDCPPDADAWRAGAEERQGSWWSDWLAWASARSGEMVQAPAFTSGEAAPGRYVLNKLGPAVDLFGAGRD